MTIKTLLRLGITILPAAACAVGPDYDQPDLPVPDSFISTYRPAVSTTADDAWWRGFNDPALTGLIDTAMAENNDIGIGVARLEEAEALIRAQRSDFFPTLDGFVEGDASEQIGNGTDGDTDIDEGDDGAGDDNGDDDPNGDPDADPDDDFDNGFGGGIEAGGDGVSAGLAFSFVPDLFGRERRGLEQARATAAAAAFSLEDVRRLTAAAVAERYVELRRTDARLALLQTSLDLQQQTLDIVTARAEAGLSADLDVRRAEADLARTRASRGDLDIAEAEASYALAVLTGRPPQAEIVPPASEDDPIPSYGAGPPVGLPADLVRRRPDLRAAEAELIAATAEIGVETADLYPTLSLPGQITADLESGNIADDVVATISATLDIPLFDAGRRRAEIFAAEARARAALLAYEQALLDSLREVETAFVAIEAEQRRLEDLATAVEASEAAFEQLDALYREGLASFIDVLDAQRILIQSRQSYVDSEADLATGIIALYRALGAPTGEAGANG